MKVGERMRSRSWIIRRIGRVGGGPATTTEVEE